MLTNEGSRMTAPKSPRKRPTSPRKRRPRGTGPKAIALRERFLSLYAEGERFVVFDVETVGHSPTIIVEIGAVEAGRDYGGRRAATFQRILRYRPRSWRPFHHALRVHKIPTREIENGEPPDDVLVEFLDWVGDATLICHTSYDIRALKQNLARFDHLATLADNPRYDEFVDSALLARALAPSLKSYKLSALAKHCQVINTNAHRGLADAITTKRVLGRLMQHVELPNPQQAQR